MTQTISNNVSNALTEGYGSREVVPGARVAGGSGMGVTVVAVVRNVDPVLLSERRVAEAQYASNTLRADFYADVEAALGLPDDPNALSNLLAGFDASLIEASTRPESDALLSSSLNAAKLVVEKLNTASEAVQTARMRADDDIEAAVAFINTTLEQIAELNKPLGVSAATSEKALNQADQRQQLIDSLAEYVPVREMQRENGTVTLFTPGGAVLLDGRPVEFGYTPAGIITPHMSLAGGTLSGLTINGQDVPVATDSGKVSGGKLAALFDVRDTQAPAAQAQLDAIARDLIERFADPAVDPTLLVADPGLFTDGGAAFLPADEVGLADRIALNALADPAQGGQVWRLRDGLGAAVPGPSGDATLLNAMSGALNANRVPASAGFASATTAAELAGAVTVGIATTQSNFSQLQAFSAARVDTLVTEELMNGVDTDKEMQTLLLVEQAYAANARVISTIEELLDTLMRI